MWTLFKLLCLHFTYLQSCLEFCKSPVCHQHSFWTLTRAAHGEGTRITRLGGGGRNRGVVHKQIYLDGGAWSKERDTVCRLPGREGGEITFQTHVKANHRGASLAFSTPQIPTAAAAFHPPVLVCTRAAHPASKCIHLFRAPRRNHSVLLSFFSRAVQMEFAWITSV